MANPPRCQCGAAWLYDSSDEQARSWSCVLCGRTYYDEPPLFPNGLPAVRPRGRPRKEESA